jgi:ribose transport system permease protein
VVFNFLLGRWKPLNQAFFIGQNPAAAQLSGLPVTLVTFAAYVISSLLAGLAGIFMTSRLAMGFFQFGLGSELNAIAGAVIGGASFAGGSGNLLGTFLGVLLLALIRNGFVLLNGSPNWQGIVSGAIVFAAIAIDAFRRRKETRE